MRRGRDVRERPVKASRTAGNADRSSPSLVISKLEALAVEPSLWPMVEEIFYRSSAVKEFASPQAKQAFFERWIGYYRDSEAARLLLALVSGSQVAGYLTGCVDSGGAARLYRDIPYYGLFEDHFDAYPAHLHVNCHPAFRNQRIGSRLVQAFTEAASQEGVGGIHVVTEPQARNVAFYRRCGFSYAVTRHWRDKELLLLGKRL